MELSGLNGVGYHVFVMLVRLYITEDLLAS
jgi:hypothetical protein